MYHSRETLLFNLKYTKCTRQAKSDEPLHDKTNKIACAPSEDSDQPGHLPSLIRILGVGLNG